MTGNTVFLSWKTFSSTGSFKERGALIVADVDARRSQRGVIAASAGNHGMASGVSQRRLNIGLHDRHADVRAVDQSHTRTPVRRDPRAERPRLRRRSSGGSALERRAQADFRLGFNDPWIVAGRAPIGLELTNKIPIWTPSSLPVGGGGLIAGSRSRSKH